MSVTDKLTACFQDMRTVVVGMMGPQPATHPAFSFAQVLNNKPQILE